MQGSVWNSDGELGPKGSGQSSKPQYRQIWMILVVFRKNRTRMVRASRLTFQYLLRKL
jgi:hypothetical protein